MHLSDHFAVSEYPFYTFMLTMHLCIIPLFHGENYDNKSKGTYVTQSYWKHWKFSPFYRYLGSCTIWIKSFKSLDKKPPHRSYLWIIPRLRNDHLFLQLTATFSIMADYVSSSKHENSASNITGNPKPSINSYHKRFCQSIRPLWYLHNNHLTLQVPAWLMKLCFMVWNERDYVWKMPEGRSNSLFNTTCS